MLWTAQTTSMSCLHQQTHETAGHIADVVGKNRVDKKQEPWCKTAGSVCSSPLLPWKLHLLKVPQPPQAHEPVGNISHSKDKAPFSGCQPPRQIVSCLIFDYQTHTQKLWSSLELFVHSVRSLQRPRASVRRRESPSLWVSLCLPQGAHSGGSHFILLWNSSSSGYFPLVWFWHHPRQRGHFSI